MFIKHSSSEKVLGFSSATNKAAWWSAWSVTLPNLVFYTRIVLWFSPSVLEQGMVSFSLACSEKDSVMWNVLFADWWKREYQGKVCGKALKTSRSYPSSLLSVHVYSVCNRYKWNLLYWQAKSNEVLRSYLVYILEQRLSDPSVCDVDQLRSCVQILTNKGPLNPTETPIHLTPRYGNTVDLARHLPSKSFPHKIANMPWVFPSSILCVVICFPTRCFCAFLVSEF